MALTARQQAFLAAYARLGWVANAARATGIARRTHYLWLKTKPEYAAAFGDTERDLCDNLLGSAIQKALVGVPEPVVWRGQIVYEPARDKETGQVIRDPETGRMVMSDTPVMIYKQSERLHLLLLELKVPEFRTTRTRRRRRTR